MADPLIQVEDVQARLGETLAEPESTQVTDWITYASARLRSDSRRLWGVDLDERIAAEELDLDLVKGAVVSAVVRALDDSKHDPRIKVEEFPEVRTEYRDLEQEYSELYFTDEELNALAPEGEAAEANRAYWHFGDY